MPSSPSSPNRSRKTVIAITQWAIDVDRDSPKHNDLARRQGGTSLGSHCVAPPANRCRLLTTLRKRGELLASRSHLSRVLWIVLTLVALPKHATA